ncbi:TetR family transcriptional regulator [Granulosicoccus sp. 3-233]|uniref:TetR family transcriptional regulator n=1 Tax=Granulosicoccus sp. 3-233 TaxID=3417969 RepID=UPI003D34F457
MATRSAERSKAAILDAATEEFLLHGYAGASVNKIADRASLNKRMLYHYFESKEGLWLAVLEAAYARLRAGEQQLDLAGLSAEDAMQELVRFNFRHLVEHPDFVLLVNIENMHKAEHLKKSTRIQQMHSPLIHLLEGVLARGHSEGVFTRKIDAAQLYIMISSLCFFHLSNRHTLTVIFEQDVSSKRAIDARCDETVAAITAYLRT